MIEIECFFHNDSTSELKELGIEYNIGDCEKRKMTFININAISPYLTEDEELCSIHSNGVEFIATKSYAEIIKLIKHHVQ